MFEVGSLVRAILTDLRGVIVDTEGGALIVWCSRCASPGYEEGIGRCELCEGSHKVTFRAATEPINTPFAAVLWGGRPYGTEAVPNAVEWDMIEVVNVVEALAELDWRA